MLLKILYVDDELDLLDIFKDMFTSPVLEVMICNKASDVKSIIQLNPPDLLLLDYRMPEMNGDQLAQVIAPFLPSSVPIALVTGDIEVKTQYKFHKVFKKPYDINAMQDYFDSLKK